MRQYASGTKAWERESSSSVLPGTIVETMTFSIVTHRADKQFNLKAIGNDSLKRLECRESLSFKGTVGSTVLICPGKRTPCFNTR